MIVAVNGDSFVNMSHEDAVRYLSSLRGSIRFELQNTIEADIEAVCDMESRYYDLYDVSIKYRNIDHRYYNDLDIFENKFNCQCLICIGR